MNFFKKHRWRRAFTRVDAVVVLVLVVLLVLLAAMLLPALARAKNRSGPNCYSNLKEIGIAFEMWRGDNGDKYPMDVPVALGGARELIAKGDVAGCFQVMSNELGAPRVLICPGDLRCKPATNWDRLGRLNISYFLGLNGSYQPPQLPQFSDDGEIIQSAVVTNGPPPGPPSLLSGDANMIQNGRPVASGTLHLETAPVTWTPDRHKGFNGDILFTDGSVQCVRRMGYTNLLEPYIPDYIVIPGSPRERFRRVGPYTVTNRVVVP
jgi:hypothetical protein